MRVRIDEGKCLGYACCVMAAPMLFEMGDDADVAMVLVPEPREADRGLVDAAVRACPARAISVEG